MTIKQQGGIFGRNPTFNDLTVEGTLTSEGSQEITGSLTVGNQTFTGSSHSITGDYSVNMSDADGGGVDIKKDAGEGSYPLYVTMQDLSNYAGANSANYQQAIKLYADAQNRYTSSGPILQAMGEIRSTYDVTSFAGDFDQGAGKLTLRARENNSNAAIDNLKDHLIIHGKGGDVELGVGNLKVQSGQGIDFSATSGTGTSELFSDYEEGVWSPSWNGGGVTVSYANYVKVGKTVTINFDITLGASSSTSTSTITLPFTSPTIYSAAALQFTSNTSYSGLVVGLNATSITFRSGITGGLLTCAQSDGFRYIGTATYISS